CFSSLKGHEEKETRSMPGSATKIMVIRHAEKPLDFPPPHGVAHTGAHHKDSLVVRGWQRAGALACLFSSAHEPHQSDGLAKPSYLYASKVQKHSPSRRPQETIG